MDDLVFENRNKEYGAYVLRKVYYDNVHKALLYVMVFFAGVMMLTIFFPGEPLINVPKVSGKVIELINVFPTVEEQKPAAQTTQVRRAVRDVAPVVSTNVQPEVETPPVENTGAGSPTGVDGGAEPTGLEGPIAEAPTTGTAPEFVVPKEPVDIAEVMPQYKGGLQAMARHVQRNLKYPAVARRMEVEGIVFVSFVVDTDGRVIDVKAIKGISKECDQEAVRMVSGMTEWLAGRQGNIPVMVRMVLPIRFQLNR